MHRAKGRMAQTKWESHSPNPSVKVAKGVQLSLSVLAAIASGTALESAR